ncbi:MAG: hypothetical protein OXF98_08235, partial [Rhodospirillaceae bacterium]|nr:hypothetical protein [Rhodospirillaceae bacterium]
MASSCASPDQVTDMNRRRLLTAMAGVAIPPLLSRAASAQQTVSPDPVARDWSGSTPVRYPDPDVIA